VGFDEVPIPCYYLLTMSQDRVIKLVSVGDKNGVGKGHTYYTFKNKKQNPDKLSMKKFNPIAKAHTEYKEKK
jgi:large subunit ribosomal protein L33